MLLRLRTCFYGVNSGRRESPRSRGRGLSHTSIGGTDKKSQTERKHPREAKSFEDTSYESPKKNGIDSRGSVA
jgi:hypothetical protein